MNRNTSTALIRALLIYVPLILTGLYCGAATLSITPVGTSNTYTGFITFQVGGLAANETVTITKYLDVNTNGVVDAADLFAQQFQVQDGQGPTLIGGATNINIPYDRNGTGGAITARTSMVGEGIIHQFAGQFLYVLSSPSNNFTPVTNSFVVSNPSTGQTITGTVLSNSTAVPFAAVLFARIVGQQGDFNPVAGTVADGNGIYSINVPAGTYQVVPLKPGYVGVPAGPFDLGTSATVNTNLALVGTTNSVSGQIVDAANTNIPLPGVLVAAQGNGFATTTSDSNGNFTVPVTTGSQWKINGDIGGWDFLGYVQYNNSTKINVTGNVTGLQLSFPKEDAMAYGRVLDANSNPIPNVRLFGQDYGSGLYQGDAATDANGGYAMALIGGQWDVAVDNGVTSVQYPNYIFSRAPYSTGSSGTNVNAGSALHQDFTALLATNSISGYLRDGSSNGISGVQVFANATINDTLFSAQATTDSTGFYSMNVGNADWSVSVNCCGGCNNGLPSGYQCPNAQDVTVANNDQTADFTAVSFNSFVSGRVADEFGSAVTNMNVFAIAPNGGGYFGATTDNGGHYQIGLPAGDYTVQMDTGIQNGAASRGLVSPFLPVTVFNNSSVSNVDLVALHISGTIIATITNSDNSQPVSGINVVGNATINGTNYSSGTQPTSGSGAATLQVCNGSWSVSLECDALSSQNLTCANSQNTGVANNTVNLSFFVHGASALAPLLTQPSRLNASQFQLHLNGSVGQNYTLQYATLLTNWSTFLVTNLNSGDAIIVDSSATNPARVYRALVGP